MLLELNAKIYGLSQQDITEALEAILDAIKEENISDLLAVSGVPYTHNDSSLTASFDVTVTHSDGSDPCALVEDPYGELHSEAYHH